VNFEIDNFSRQAIGFDRLFDVMNNIRGKDVNYPPYDIIKQDEETFLIEFALSGFSKDDLNITVKENHLTIEGDYIKAEDYEYLHKGIAKRSFTRDFVLADTLHVEDVTFSEGILRVTLKQIVPEEQKPKKIKIN
jgi:molecular chaperone IbpA